MQKFLIPLTAVLAATAFAAPKISPQSIIVNPVPQPGVGVSVWTDRDPSGNGIPNYRVGEHIRIYTSVTQDAYVYLFNVNPDGSIDQILPNRLGGDNFVKAGATKVFPAPGDNFTFDISGPAGINKVLALASTAPLNLNQISSFTAGQPFAKVNVQGQQNLAQALSIVVNPVPQDSWITDTAQYNVLGVDVVTPPSRPNPVVTYPAPNWNQSSSWNYSFSGNHSLRAVYDFYSGELQRQGYRLVESVQRGNRIEARYTRGSDRATLKVEQRGNRFDVKIERRN